MVDPSAHPQHMNNLKHIVCVEWMWAPFHVSLGPQPINLDIICSFTVTQAFSQLLKAYKYKYGYGGNGMMMWEPFHVECGSGASISPPLHH